MSRLTYEDEYHLYEALHIVELVLIDDLQEHSERLWSCLVTAEKLLPNQGRNDVAPEAYFAPDDSDTLRTAIQDLRDQCPLRIRSLLIHEHLRTALRGIIIADLIESPPELEKSILHVVD